MTKKVYIVEIKEFIRTNHGELLMPKDSTSKVCSSLKKAKAFYDAYVNTLRESRADLEPFDNYLFVTGEQDYDYRNIRRVIALKYHYLW